MIAATVMEHDPSLPFRAGYRLGRYELLFPLAEGGMAVVWLARMRGTRGFEKTVAVKLIRPQFGSEERFEKMFLDEAQIASKIHHPNVVQTMDLGEQDGTLYLVMEWVEGESLARFHRLLRKRGVELPLPIALRIIADSCAALHAAHELRGDDGRLLGVVHRDVSPQNTLVSYAGSVKVIDFGIAKARNRASAQTTEGVIKGKIPYLAPEQARGHPLDRAVDIWASGVCLYQLIAGELPYDDDDPQKIIKMIMSGAPPEPLPAAVPASVRAIVDRALDPQPERRFPTAAAMQKALEAALVELSAAITTDEIADFIQTHLGDHVLERRARTAEGIRSAQAKIGGDDPPTSADAHPYPVVTLAGSELQTIETASAVSRATSAAQTAPSAKRSSLFVWVVVAVLGAIAGVFAVLAIRAPEKNDVPAKAAQPRESVTIPPPSTSPIASTKVAAVPSTSASSSAAVSKKSVTGAAAPAKSLSPGGKDYGF